VTTRIYRYEVPVQAQPSGPPSRKGTNA
jgi:hypothetical protein